MWRTSFSYSYRISCWLSALLLALTLFLAPLTTVEAAPASAGPATYTNPLPVKVPGDGNVESCADPSIIHSRTPGDKAWYMYCTTDPLNGADRNPSTNNLNFHFIPTLKSLDLVNWTYVGDAFTTRPAWVDPNSGFWAPDIQFFNGQYYLYYTAPDTNLPGHDDSAIGVATGPTPTGPWTDSGGPVVEVHPAPCCPGSQRWVFDPAIVKDKNGQRYIFYGSYFGGISARKLSADGLHSDPATQTQITIANRYEGAYVIQHDEYYYLFGSATNCCNGPLTGYSVFAGRSKNILGPYKDREGVSLLDSRVGGTPVISMNGNRWVGTGHNAVFEDFAGQDWMVYHAVDRNDPYFSGASGFTKRPVLLDALDWVDEWPMVRAGRWASDTPQPAPAAQPGQPNRHIEISPLEDDQGDEIERLTDEFNGNSLKARWSWVRPPAATSYGVQGGNFRFDTQAADLYVDNNSASVLTEAAPQGNYIVETRVKLNVPATGDAFNYVQAGLVIYGSDDNFIKLAHVSIFETRQTEFAKEVSPVPPGYPRYGNTVVGPPGGWTYLRIAKRTQNGEELYTAYTSRDGDNWVHGGTWTHNLGSNARIGLIAFGGAGFTATFDYVHVNRLVRY